MRLYAAKKGRNHYVIFYDKDRQPQRKWVSLQTKNTTVARQKIAKFEKDLAFGRLSDPWTSKLLTTSNKALDYWISKFISRKTYADSAPVHGRLKSFAREVSEDTSVLLITKEHILRSISSYGTAESRNQQRQVLHALFKYLLAENVLAYNPASNIEREAASSPRSALWPDEIIALKEASSEEMQMVIDCLVCSGLRIGEFLSLEPEDIEVDDQKSQLTVQNKKIYGESSRTVILYPRGRDSFRTFRHETMRTKSAAHYQRKMVEASMFALGGRRITPHWLRHTYISWMLNDLGLPLQIVSPMVGHLHYSTTRKYAHATDESMKRMLMRAVGIFDPSTVSPVADYLYPNRPKHPL